MEYQIRALTLHRPIRAPEAGQSVAADGTASIEAYISRVAKNCLEPPAADHLTGGEAIAEIPAGRYLFAQAPLPDDEGKKKAAFRDAAEAVWLESLWLEVGFADDRVIVRVVREDGKAVFQALRAVSD